MKWPWTIKKPVCCEDEVDSEVTVWMCDQWFRWTVRRIWVGSGRNRRVAFMLSAHPVRYPFYSYTKSVVTFPSGIDKTIRAIYTGIRRTYDANLVLEDLDR